MESFLPRRPTPRKEGRSHPFHYPASSRRRNITPRVVVIIAAVFAACIFAIFYLSSGHGGSNSPAAKAPPFEKVKAPPPPKADLGGVSEDDAVVPEKPAPVLTPPAPVGEIKVEPDFIPDLKGDHSPQRQSTVVNPSMSGATRPGFETALERVLAMLPDEMHQRELLRPFDGTGKEKLREIGLRSRAYKTFFEAWEKLHVIVDEGSTYVRDDILPYLRARYDAGDYAESRSFAQTMRSYESYRFFLSRLSTLLFPWTAPYFADHMSLHASFHRGGRGIVLTAGDEQAPYLLASIPSFRELGCNLPIEIMYLGDSDLSEDFRAELEAMPGVSTRDLSQMVNDEGWRLAGWAGKPFTILFSSFREVIFIDADSLFFHNPEILFDDPEYKKTGALFFRDRLIMPESKKRWLQAILPKPISKQVRQSRMWLGDSGHMQESGVVVVDKWKHFVALLLVTRMNGPDRDGNKDEGIIGIYDMVYGDKETFWIGWELVGDTEYSFHQGDAGIMGVVEEPEPEEEPHVPHGDEEHEREHEEERRKKRHKQRKHAPGHEDDLTICAPQLLHLDLEGKPLWFNGWLYNNKFAGNKKQGGKFEVYMKEPREVLDPGAWQLEESNMCCLSNKEVYKFTQEESDKLDMMIGFAKEAGSYSKSD